MQRTRTDATDGRDRCHLSSPDPLDFVEVDLVAGAVVNPTAVSASFPVG
jgi:hypothetical protein